ncbi:hypothetical protein F2Q68_00025626 [Brassica cretica]|uniref:Uncharacterized protein n=1 Tax=Brassica cretica TaxID=69181 RepID=A0A8S9IHQ1_BRACR|nr:hypothetical protein F2Q68_00025626 [Brassica cretica]
MPGDSIPIFIAHHAPVSTPADRNSNTRIRESQFAFLLGVSGSVEFLHQIVGFKVLFGSSGAPTAGTPDTSLPSSFQPLHLAPVGSSIKSLRRASPLFE